VKTFGGMTTTTDAATVLSNQLPQTASGTSYNPDGSTSRLIINLPKTAFNSIDWWGEGDPARSGVIPNQTGCVNGVNADGSTDDVGPQGERFNGALVVTIIKADTPADALELNVPGQPKYGWRVKVTAAPNPFAQWVLGEYTMFWHHPNGKCYMDSGWVPNPPQDFSGSTRASTRAPNSADPTGGTFGSGSGSGSGGSGTGGGTGSTSTTTTITLDDGTTITQTITLNADGTVTVTIVGPNGTQVYTVPPATGGKERDNRIKSGRLSWKELIQP